MALIVSVQKAQVQRPTTENHLENKRQETDLTQYNLKCHCTPALTDNEAKHAALVILLNWKINSA